MNTTEVLKVYSGLKKSEISNLANVAVESLLESGNVLEVAESLSAMEEFIKSVKGDKRFTEYVREETTKFGKQFSSASGAKIELAEVGTKYDFNVCADPELQRWEQQLTSAEDMVKKRKDFLKTIPVEGIEIITDDEVVRVYPPAKSSTSSYKITLAK